MLPQFSKGLTGGALVVALVVAVGPADSQNYYAALLCMCGSREFKPLLLLAQNCLPTDW